METANILTRKKLKKKTDYNSLKPIKFIQLKAIMCIASCCLQVFVKMKM